MTAGGATGCAACGADNRAGRRFCASCGAPLALACAACGFANEAGEKFCGGCGASLGAVPVPPATGSADAERRPVTVLFADLCGYTRLSQALDPEDTHRMLERFFGEVDAIVERFGGRVDKHIGDAVMAIFGAPVARGDEPSRAVRAADAIVRAMPAIETPHGRPLDVHVGIASGEVVASGMGSDASRAYTVIGPSVNLAARLVGVAKAGEIVVDGAVHAAVGHEAACEALEALDIKGVDGPVTAWRLASLREAGTGASATQFVGRAGELAQLAALIRTCVASGTGTVVHVRGDPGIGKSRLVQELARTAAAEGFACHTGLVLDFGTAKGRGPVRDVVASLVGLVPTAGAEERARALAAMAASGAIARERTPFLADLLGLPLPDEGRALYEAMDNAARHRVRGEVLAGLVLSAARTGPVLITIEDLHWADAVTLTYVATLARATARACAVLVLTSRVDGDPLAGGFRASLAGAPLATLDLAPLSEREAASLAGGLVATTGRFARKCVERAGGNPLFLEQLLRTADEGEDRLPASLASLVLARVDRLAEPDRAALRAAAVVGQRFPLALLRHLVAAPGYDCASLLAASLVRPDGDEFMFAHALIRDGVYASLTRPRRAELHRAAAAWYGERDPTLTAEHLDRAEAPEAARAYLEAARAQSVALYSERALALAERGAALAREPGDVVALNLLLGRLHFEVGDGKPSIAAYEAALGAAVEPADRCRAWLGIAAGQRLLAGLDAAMAALAEALPLARGHGLLHELAELHYTRGNLHFARSEADACRAEHGKALACAEQLGDPGWQARATSGLADAEYIEGRMRTALARFTQCIELCERHGLARVAIPNRIMIGHCRSYLAEFDAGILDMRAGGAAAARLGDRHGEMFALESEGLLLVLCSRYDEAVPALRRGLALADAIGARRYQATMLCALAETDAAAGRIGEANEHVEQALALSRATDMRFCGPMVLGVKASLQPAGAAREACRDEADALLAQTCVGHNAISYHRCGIEDTLARGEWARARAHAAALEDYTREEPLPFVDFLIARGRTLAALGEDPGDAAARREIERLRSEALRLDWRLGWPTIG